MAGETNREETELLVKMPNEFDRYVNKGVVVWKCRTCHVKFGGKDKPRAHICTDNPTPTRGNAVPSPYLFDPTVGATPHQPFPHQSPVIAANLAPSTAAGGSSNVHNPSTVGIFKVSHR